MLNTTYLPRDENFSAEKSNLFNAAILQIVGQDLIPAIQSLITNNNPFKTFNEIRDLYDSDPKNPRLINLDTTPINFPLPGVVAGKCSLLLYIILWIYGRVQGNCNKISTLK